MVRGEYALKECGDCGVQLPANEMTHVTDRVLSSTRRGNRVYKGVRGGVGFGTANSNTYRIERKLVCPRCMAIRIERRRRERRAKLIGSLFLLGLLLVVVMTAMLSSNYFSETSTKPVSSENGTVPAGSSTDASTPARDGPAVSSAPVEVPAGAERQSAPETSDPSAPPTAQQPSPPSTTDEPAPDRTEQEMAIAAAAREALNTGQPARWKAAGTSGYVVVSSAQTYTDRVCRNVSATVINGHDQTTSAPHQWCQLTSGGDWAPQ